MRGPDGGGDSVIRGRHFGQPAMVERIGPFDGHLSNTDAYADESLESVIYR
jgi:hypothetical protein